MKREEILNLPSMPVAGPSYPHGPYRFIDREYFIVVYESEEDTLSVQTYIWRGDDWGLTAIRRFPRGREPLAAQPLPVPAKLSTSGP